MSDDVREVLAAFQRVCVGPEVAAEDVALLETKTTGRARFELYRDLVRIRLRDLVCSAFPRTTHAIGRARMIALADRHITAEPPASRFFREHAAAFAVWALPILGESPEPAHAVDLFRLETAQWRANYTVDAPIAELAELDLEGIAVPSATLTRLDTRFDVHVSGDAAPKEGAYRLAVYRRPDHRVETRWMEPIWADLLDALARSDRAAIDCVREVLARHGRVADATFVDEMTTFLSLLVTNGALLGSRPA
jgi:hypothetical protein